MIALVVLVWLACAAFCYMVGKDKGRATEAALLGLLLGIIGVFIVLFMKSPAEKEALQNSPSWSNEQVRAWYAQTKSKSAVQPKRQLVKTDPDTPWKARQSS